MLPSWIRSSKGQTLACILGNAHDEPRFFSMSLCLAPVSGLGTLGEVYLLGVRESLPLSMWAKSLGVRSGSRRVAPSRAWLEVLLFVTVFAGISSFSL